MPHHTPRCIITGCDIQILNYHQHGDLFELADCYIFNAVGEASYGDKFYSSASRCLLVRDSLHLAYFERRNVFVIAKSDAILNEAAKAYLEGAPR